jgi:hypothetical protein
LDFSILIGFFHFFWIFQGMGARLEVFIIYSGEGGMAGVGHDPKTRLL